MGDCVVHSRRLKLMWGEILLANALRRSAGSNRCIGEIQAFPGLRPSRRGGGECVGFRAHATPVPFSQLPLHQSRIRTHGDGINIRVAQIAWDHSYRLPTLLARPQLNRGYVVPTQGQDIPEERKVGHPLMDGRRSSLLLLERSGSSLIGRGWMK